jgi:hypothetical protein
MSSYSNHPRGAILSDLIFSKKKYIPCFGIGDFPDDERSDFFGETISNLDFYIYYYP